LTSVEDGLYINNNNLNNINSLKELQKVIKSN
jgi:hypothetical protein